MTTRSLQWFVLTALMVLVQPHTFAQSQPEFPQLTGRVVDNADMLSASVEARLTQMLAAHEQATTEQVVVVTVPTLKGYPIEAYGYQLGRHWGIGQKGDDNGALLIIAKEERRIRIEVGYGLEGRLTDAASATIINQIIMPAFRAGDFSSGIASGTEAIIQVLGGEPLAVSRAVAPQDKPHPGLGLLFLIIVLMSFFGGRGDRGGRGRAALLGGLAAGSMMGGGRSGGGFGGGGFGGGGGGFGGGGASGGW